MTIYSDFHTLTVSLLIASALAAFLWGLLCFASLKIVRGMNGAPKRHICVNGGDMPKPADFICMSFLPGICRSKKYGKTVPAGYYFGECLMIFMSILCLLKYDISVLCLRNFLLLCCLFMISAADLEAMQIPDVLIVIMTGIWAAYLPFEKNMKAELRSGIMTALSAAGAVFVISFITDAVTGKKSLGGGDIKLLFAAGLYLKMDGMLIAIVSSCLLGICFALAGQRNKKEYFPFGPAIALSVWMTLLYGDVIINRLSRYLL